jgi:septal ring factor EnvC (AmiA/AmiB activator)
MAEGLGDRLTQLERAVRRAADLIARLKAEQATLEKRVTEQARELDDLRPRASASAEERAELQRLRQERKEVLAQVDSVLKELDKLEAP